MVVNVESIGIGTAPLRAALPACRASRDVAEVGRGAPVAKGHHGAGLRMGGRGWALVLDGFEPIFIDFKWFLGGVLCV